MRTYPSSSHRGSGSSRGARSGAAQPVAHLIGRPPVQLGVAAVAHDERPRVAGRRQDLLEVAGRRARSPGRGRRSTSPPAARAPRLRAAAARKPSSCWRTVRTTYARGPACGGSGDPSSATTTSNRSAARVCRSSPASSRFELLGAAVDGDDDADVGGRAHRSARRRSAYASAAARPGRPDLDPVAEPGRGGVGEGGGDGGAEVVGGGHDPRKSAGQLVDVGAATHERPPTRLDPGVERTGGADVPVGGEGDVGLQDRLEQLLVGEVTGDAEADAALRGIPGQALRIGGMTLSDGAVVGDRDLARRAAQRGRDVDGVLDPLSGVEEAQHREVGGSVDRPRWAGSGADGGGARPAGGPRGSAGPAPRARPGPRTGRGGRPRTRWPRRP